MARYKKLVLVLFCTSYFCLGEDSSGENVKTGYERSETALADLALAVFNRKLLYRAAIISCKSEANWAVFRKMATEIPTSIVTPTTMWRLDRTDFRVGVLFATETCPMADSLILEIQPYVDSSYHWLVIGKESNFEGLTLRFDSSITAVLKLGECYQLFDIYYDSVDNQQKALDVGRFVTKPMSALVDWVNAENAVVRSRVNRAVKAGILVVNASEWSRPLDMERFTFLSGHPRVAGPHFSMQNYNEYEALAELYNISTTYSVFDVTGFVNKTTNTFNNYLAGGLHRLAFEISVSKILLNEERRERMDILAPCDPYSEGVIYYVDRSVDAPTALLDPFSARLWLCVVGSIILGIFCLYFIGSLETMCTQVDADLSLGDTVLVIVGSFTGQGHPIELRWLASRFVCAVFLLTGFVVASAYSAVITRALLSAPSPNIRSRREYMESALSMAVEDFFAFTKITFGAQMDKLNRELYDKKVRPPAGPGFRKTTEAFDGMLAQRWAMLAQVNNIKLQMAKATPQQVCRVSWIHGMGKKDLLCPALKKRSELKNIFSKGYVLGLERGVRDRARRRQYASDISCAAAFRRQWVPVKLELVVTAFGLLYAGILAATLLCLFERLMSLIWLIAERSSHDKRTEISVRLLEATPDGGHMWADQVYVPQEKNQKFCHRSTSDVARGARSSSIALY